MGIHWGIEPIEPLPSSFLSIQINLIRIFKQCHAVGTSSVSSSRPGIYHFALRKKGIQQNTRLVGRGREIAIRRRCQESVLDRQPRPPLLPCSSSLIIEITNEATTEQQNERQRGVLYLYCNLDSIKAARQGCQMAIARF